MSVKVLHALDDGIIDVYMLAAPAEEDECKAIQKHLKPIIRNSGIPINVCSDFDNLGGSVIAEQKARLLKADIVLALISADFIDDDETYDRTQKVIDRSNRNETILIPILVRNCMWKDTPFVKLPVLPKNFQPLNNKQFWNSEDDALMAVVEDIYESIKAFSYVKPAPPVAIASMSDIQTPEDVIATVIQSETLVKESSENITATANEDGKATVGIMDPNAGALDEKDKLPKPDSTPPKSRFADAKKRMASAPMEVDWRKVYYKRILWKRAAAFVLDGLLVPVFGGISFIVVVIAASIGETAEISDKTPDMSDKEALALLFTSLCLYLITCAAFESSKLRGSIGKRLLRVQITTCEGNPISFFRALWRNTLKTIFAFLYIFLFPFQIRRFIKTKKLFHDELSNTVIGERLTARVPAVV